MKLKDRIAAVKYAWDENRHMTRMQGGLGYEVYCRGMEMQWEIEHGIRGIRPNTRGLWLITLATEFLWYAKGVWFVLTGHDLRANYNEDAMGDMMGRNE
jgi:hypothetical protein